VGGTERQWTKGLGAAGGLVGVVGGVWSRREWGGGGVGGHGATACVITKFNGDGSGGGAWGGSENK